MCPFYDVTYKIIHHRPFKAPSEQWIRDFLNEENGVEIINITQIIGDEEWIWMMSLRSLKRKIQNSF